MRPLPESSRSPFSLPGDRASALLLHGYSGTPYEVLPLGVALSERGIAAVGPLLPGHGTSPEALNQTPWSAWLNEALAAFDALPAERPRVVVGCSMGGLLAILIAARRAREVAGVVLLSPALLFHPGGSVGIGLSRAGLWRVRPMIEKESPGGDVDDEEAQRKNPTYPVLPVKGLCELDALRREAIATLPALRAPVCVLHGALDRTIAPRAVDVVARTCGATFLETHLLPRSRHLVALDVERDTVVDLASRFVERAVLGAC